MIDKIEISPRFLRLKHIIGDKKSTPPIPAIIPISKTAWWNGVSSGKFPKPLKLAENITVWRSDDIQALVDDICKTGTQDAA
jgi:predicted DNA-binding transcriptional regulator AlpA